jgi:hypothetical protein
MVKRIMKFEGVNPDLSYDDQHLHVLGNVIQKVYSLFSISRLKAQIQQTFVHLAADEYRSVIRLCIADIIRNKRRSEFRRSGVSKTRGRGRPVKHDSIRQRVRKVRRREF